MPSLLCTLGSSWAVVPEAFLLGNGADAYDDVTIVTTDSPPTRRSLAQVLAWFHVDQAFLSAARKAALRSITIPPIARP